MTKRISQLDPDAAPDATAIFESERAGHSYRLTAAQLKASIGTSFDDAWVVTPTTIIAAGGTFTATGVLRVKKVGKLVLFDLDALTTSYAATPTGPVSVTMPYPSMSRVSFAANNNLTLLSVVATMGAASSTLVLNGQGGAFPVTANGQRLVASGSYETT